jgi:hypothetical protein
MSAWSGLIPCWFIKKSRAVAIESIFNTLVNYRQAQSPENVYFTCFL